MLLDPGDGDVAASELQIRLDLAQLIVELALYVGPEKSARVAIEKVGDADELVAVLPLLQPVVLVRSTRHALRRRRDVLPAVRKALLEAVPEGEVMPVQLERIRARTLVTLVASVAAAYLLAGELAQASFGHLLRSADWRWALVALALSAATYVGATLSISGFVAERLSFCRTLFVQLASSFVTLVTPAAVGGAALNVRYLQRRRIPAAVAVASVGVSQVVAFVLHILLLTVFAAIAGTSTKSAIRPPTWAYFVVAGLVVLAGVVLAIPAGRRMVRARLSPTFGQVLPRLLEVAQQPRKLAEGIGGVLLLSLTYILCLSACVAAFGGSVLHREDRLRVPDRKRDRLDHPHPGRARRGGGRADRGAYRRGRARRHRGQRGPAVPPADLLASRAHRLGGDELPGTPARPLGGPTQGLGVTS